jgi:multiple sugar transport system permease protein
MILMVQDRRIVALFVGSISACIYYWRPVDLRGYAIILFVQFVYRRTSVGRLEQLQQGIARSSFWNSLTNGLIIAISSIVLQVVLGVGIAMVLNKRFLADRCTRDRYSSVLCRPLSPAW